MSEGRLNVCDYWGCDNPIAPNEKNIQTGMRFCESHQSEIEKLFETGNVMGVLSFWVKASGGAKKMVHTPAGVYQSHEKATKGKDL